MFSFVYLDKLSKIELPHMVRVRQQLHYAPLKGDVYHVVFEKFQDESVWKRLIRFSQQGKAAIGVGSRGIEKLKDVVKAVVSVLKQLGMEVFIVPAMGSHGGGTEEGQKRILASYGVTEESMGCQVIASMELVNLGHVSKGMPVYFDKEASRCDVVVAINRIKPHLEINGEIGSGILKMLSIGFGKVQGAATLHTYGAEDLSAAITDAANLIIARIPLIVGVGLLEDGYGQLSSIQVITSQDIEEEEKKLLKQAKNLMPHLPFDEIDVLVVDEMGKNISGSGVDINVVGRKKQASTKIRCIVVCDLTPESHGNAAGIGLVDIITQRLSRKIDFRATYINCVTARALNAAKLPMVADTDEMAIKLALYLSGRDPGDIRLARIKNTAKLDIMEISQKLVIETDKVQSISEPFQYQFDSTGKLVNQIDQGKEGQCSRSD